MPAVTVAPTFVADIATLKASLRLSSVADDTDVSSILSDAIREARLAFMTRLGISRVAAIVAMTYDPETAAPATADELTREAANITETLMVRRTLLRRLPVMFRESSSQAMISFQQDALTRERNADAQREQDELSATIEANLRLLEGGDSEVTYRATTIEPDSIPVLGESVNGSDGSLGRLDG